MALTFVYSDDIAGTPAAVDRMTGVIYLNPDLFDNLSDFEKRFVVLHEEGHYILNTSDEVAADAYAFDQMAGTEFRSLKQMIATLDKLLVKGNITRGERLNELYKRALQWDAENGNPEAAAELERIASTPVNSFLGLPSYDTVKQTFELTSLLTTQNLLIAIGVIIFLYLFFTM